ncbi:BQ5605_C010g06157 [Microbotryum silenes-dioicae]|uniref:BQ5605_C010g06157 protein n=1 Tax=Microbotryum silenes-dioicae TaxID=796604 RepID=A0A2X0LV76_9BASI|nr:BQ5605_C010g06157 [Microbotryum silenes-dioicae]
MEGFVALRLWCTDDAEQTTADGLPDLTSFARSPGDTIDETDDNTNEGVDFDMSDHSSDDLSHYSIDATDNGAFVLEEWEFNAEDDGSDDETWEIFNGCLESKALVPKASIQTDDASARVLLPFH